MSKSTGILDAASVRPWEGGPSFSLSNRLYRLAWTMCWTLLAARSPVPLHGWRRLLLRSFGARIAATAKVYPSAQIWSPANLEMHDHSSVGPGATVYAMGQITIEAYAIISQGAYLCAGTHDIENEGFQLRIAPITIGTRAWVAAQAFVGPGVTVGDGAVLGARGCAMRNLEAWTVYSGNPATALKPRRVRFPASV